MRIRNAYDKLMNNEVKTRLLRVLCRHDAEWTGRQLSRELGVSPTTASKFLKELVSEGVVNMKGAGRSHMYNLNNKSYVVKKLLKPFFEKEKDIFSSIVSLIKKAISKTNVNVESVAFFGSIAQKNDTPGSDIDLLIIVSSSRDKSKIEAGLDSISIEVAENFQTVVSPYILSSAQFKKMYKMKRPIILEILKSYILVTGKTPERIVV